ncbi:MAG: DUF5947 family protein [Chloroflexota bacterium]|nr:DUF5947 family protein [Chloroflexota bacterium]
MSARPPGLARFLAPPPVVRPGERCDMCREVLPDEHSHVVALENRNLMCTCRACYLLFTREGAAQGKYKAVPDRYLYDPGLALSEADWEALQIPVRMAFFFYNSAMQRLVAFYPSPAGATESLLPADAWPGRLRADLEPDVEALLVWRSDAGFECFLVPIDACYELVGRVRRSWKGFDGGQQAWADIADFFDALRQRSKQVAWAS